MTRRASGALILGCALLFSCGGAKSPPESPAAGYAQKAQPGDADGAAEERPSSMDDEPPPPGMPTPGSTHSPPPEAPHPTDRDGAQLRAVFQMVDSGAVATLSLSEAELYLGHADELSSGADCLTACKALLAMRRLKSRICEVSGGADSAACERATARVERAENRVREAPCLCSREDGAPGDGPRDP